ncbi:DinB family protein [Actinophytocola gossypii]|uniref:DinB family protein n=1 Tax=Actinophytocola gossypii TaxID=2812003 RepID=A0ABT2JA94_9PSEU|nr:DinB family protein [Actinophytocola gossypii]MCT2584783.1 DinB family protein [Actinophytocola gossypii]
MTLQPIPESNISGKITDPARFDPPLLADEHTMLAAYLDFQRETLALKCADIPGREHSAALLPPSTLTLHGLVRHLSGVERWWLHLQFAGDDTGMLYYSDDDPEQDFESLDGDFDAAVAVWRAQVERSREIVAGAAPEDTGTQIQTGDAFSLRWVLLRMIAEYARHLGHADLLRERIDGATGW